MVSRCFCRGRAAHADACRVAQLANLPEPLFYMPKMLNIEEQACSTAEYSTKYTTKSDNVRDSHAVQVRVLSVAV